METINIGDKIKVINNTSNHGTPLGSILTIKDINPQNQNHEKYWMKETRNYFFKNDIKKIPPQNLKKGNFIITDPLFIMNQKQFDEIQENHEKYKEPNFENLQFPIKSIHYQTKEPFIIHIIERTPYGGGEAEFENQTIKTETGMLCIAENPKEWLKESYGAKFDTLLLAQDNFQTILNKF